MWKGNPHLVKSMFDNFPHPFLSAHVLFMLAAHTEWIRGDVYLPRRGVHV